MGKRIEDYLGKKINACEYIGHRINFNANNITLCHEAEVGAYILGNVDDFSLNNYELSLLRHIAEVEEGCSICNRCSKCKSIKFENKIAYITINTSDYCNSSCIYCDAHYGKEGSGYNPIPLLEKVKCYIDDNCFFDWGGGEPTLNPYFEESIRWISENGYRQRINTNGIIYSEETEKALDKGTASLRMSLDAGTKECFYRVKGHDKYEDVWNHIRAYRKVSDNIYLKYNVFNLNSEKKEIDEFLRKSTDVDIKHIIIDAEISAYQRELNKGPFFFTRKEFDAIHYLWDECKKKNIDVTVSGYAFSVRPEYDEDKQLKLPSLYFDNIDWETISNGIFPDIFANTTQLIDQIKNKDIIIFGAGSRGKQLLKLCQINKIKGIRIIDNDSTKIGKQIDGIIIEDAQTVLKESNNTFLVVGRYAAEQVKEINNHADKSNKIIWVKEFDI